jgi:hypothetical protein
MPLPHKPQAGRFGDARTSLDRCSDRNEHRTPSKLPHSIATTTALVITCFTSKWPVCNAAGRHSGSEAEVPDALIVADDDLQTMTGCRLRNSGSLFEQVRDVQKGI